MEIAENRVNAAKAIEEALLCACEGGQRDIAIRLFRTGARLTNKQVPSFFLVSHQRNSYKAVPLPRGQWGVEWSTDGVTQGMVFCRFDLEVEALGAVYALERMDKLEAPIRLARIRSANGIPVPPIATSASPEV
jgi:hypothetical protein